MTPDQSSALLDELCALPNETDWVEFKADNCDPEMIGKSISGLANAAALSKRPVGYLVWGVEDGTHKVTGTSFKPHQAKKGGEALLNWLMRMLTPQVDFRFHEWSHDGRAIVLLEVFTASHRPVGFSGQEYIRIGSHTKALKDQPQKEAALWAVFDRTPFERGIAKADLADHEVTTLLDVAKFCELLSLPQPTDLKSTLERLALEHLVHPQPGGRYDVTNLGAMLFAKDLTRFDRLSRKALRIVKYRNAGRTETEREWRDPPSQSGYAVAFAAAVAFIHSQLPHNEPIGQALRTEVRMYPETAIRELAANALIHQDFTVSGAGPMVELFPDRIEITNPGEPLVDPLRFIDTPPRSRNEGLAALMRRMRICEESGTGIDKVVAAVEAFQLPAPDFTVIATMRPGSTKATLFAPRQWSEMDSADRVRACYQHACLMFVANRRMTNASLRTRLGVDSRNYAAVSRVIRDAIDRKLVKAFDPATGNRYMQYLPFWA